MTQNSWPQDGSLETPATAQQVPSRQPSTFPPAQNAGAPATPHPHAGSRSDAAKDEAADVARQATDAVQNVTDTAKSEAANVAAEVKTSARDLMAQAKSDLTDQAGTQQQKVAEGLRSVSTELHSMVSASDQPGVATDLVRQAAERSSAVASWLDGRDPGSLLTEVTSFARQKPGTFLLLAAGAGILAGRLSRSLSAGAPDPARNAAPAVGTAAPVTRVPDTGMAVPPPPVELPAPEMTMASAGSTYPPNPHGTEAQTGTGGQDRWDSEPVVTDPLQPVDPLRHDPFEGGRR
ncbi:hypothetical protein KY499_11285 [Arthrobacter sp. PAMC25284]|nr:hypothetical protein KY499_11285 [Arthrobacter sp. PAMC25284]